MPLWGIAYTKDVKGRVLKEPFLWPDTVRPTRRGAWEAFRYGHRGPLPSERKLGAKAVKVRMEIIEPDPDPGPRDEGEEGGDGA